MGSHTTCSMAIWKILSGLWMGLGIRVTCDSDGSIGRDGRLVISRSDIGSWTELRIKLTSVLGLSVLTRSRRRVDNELRSGQVQASREWSDGSSIFGTPSTESFSTHERSIPDNVDILGTDADNDTLHSEGNTTRGRVLSHNDSISKSELLAVQSMDRMRWLENSLSGNTIDRSPLDRIVCLLRRELISDLLNLANGFLSVSSARRSSGRQLTCSSFSAKRETVSKSANPSCVSHFFISLITWSGSSAVGHNSADLTKPIHQQLSSAIDQRWTHLHLQRRGY